MNGTVHVRRTVKSFVVEAYWDLHGGTSLGWRRYIPADRIDLVRREIEAYSDRWTVKIHESARRALGELPDPPAEHPETEGREKR